MVNDSESEKSKTDEQEKSYLVKIFTNPEKLFRISAGLILFALIAPLLFTHCSTGFVFDDDATNISSGISIMNPFIAIAAAIITFAAFWVQYKANMDLREEAKKDREQAKIDREDNQEERVKAEKRNRKQQIINRFYEMLQIHRENVKELEWNQKIQYENNEGSYRQKNECVQKRGRQIFFYYLVEFDFIYEIIESFYSDLDIKDKVKKAYNIFYRNSSDDLFNHDVREKVRKNIEFGINQLSMGGTPFDDVVNMVLTLICKSLNKDNFPIYAIARILRCKDFFSLQPLFKVHFEELNNYYRHLFLTVKTIAKEKEEHLSYDEKRDLLRILRAQLTNTEQIMLFYNWFSENGRSWEQDDLNGNHFFTEYHMIHNIMPRRMLPIRLLCIQNNPYQNFIDYFGQKPIYSFIKEYCSKDDPMFEFEDREDCPKFDYDK